MAGQVEIISTERIAELAPSRRRKTSNPFHVYIARLGSPHSRRAMTGALRKIATILAEADVEDPAAFPWWEVRYQHAQAARTVLAERHAPSTVNQALSALRGVLKECWRLDLLEAADYHRAADVEPAKGTTIPAGREVTAHEAAQLFDVCADETPGGARNALLLSLLYGCGLRRAEAVALRIEDVDHETGSVRVLRGKGNKGRLVYMDNGSRNSLIAWLVVRGLRAGPLLCRVTKSGAIALDKDLAPAPITAQAAYDAIERVRKQAKLAPFSPHDLRRTFCGDMLDAGADLVTVQALMGHSSPATTAKYDRRGERAKAEAMQLRHTPYRAAAS